VTDFSGDERHHRRTVSTENDQATSDDTSIQVDKHKRTTRPKPEKLTGDHALGNENMASRPYLHPPFWSTSTSRPAAPNMCYGKLF